MEKIMKSHNEKNGKRFLSVSTIFLVLFALILSAGFISCSADGILGIDDGDFDIFGFDDDNDDGSSISIIAWSGISPGFIGSVLIINIDCGDGGSSGDSNSGGDEGSDPVEPEVTTALTLNVDGTGTYGDLPGNWIYVSETENCSCKYIYLNDVQVAGIRFTVSGGEVLEFTKDENDVWCLVTELEARINAAANADDSGDDTGDDQNGPTQLM